MSPRAGSGQSPATTSPRARPGSSAAPEGGAGASQMIRGAGTWASASSGTPQAPQAPWKPWALGDIRALGALAPCPGESPRIGPSTGASGGRNRALIWAGPGSRVSVPAAASTALRTCPAMEARPASSPRPAGAVRSAGMSAVARGARAKMPACSVVWFAPVPTSSWGRSVETTRRGMPAASASASAGWRFATAVPEVVTTAAGARWPARSAARLMPRAVKPALRSSSTTRSPRSPASSASARA